MYTSKIECFAVPVAAGVSGGGSGEGTTTQGFKHSGDESDEFAGSGQVRGKRLRCDNRSSR